MASHAMSGLDRIAALLTTYIEYTPYDNIINRKTFKLSNDVYYIKKAFDRVHSNWFWYKLIFVGIRGKMPQAVKLV